ncbi:hypothetical protein PVAG01_02196 [Phlyctema vagabunda]|uniref:NACHT-NTPase and P-loop NTPases N-terminal domain-containing protein n=1 Tax=Phlyctema vagabunda TaxID=108571 RepID=A0ABR4PQ54_9HELO
MSGVEVLGALAATVQIVSYAPVIIQTISQIYGAFKNAPVEIQQGCRHLEDLLDTVETIKLNESLQTSSTKAHLETLKQRIVALLAILTGIVSRLDRPPLKRIFTICSRPRYEVRIAKALGQIEGDKSALVLNILNINAQLASSTSVNIGELAKALPEAARDREEIKAIRSLSSTILRTLNRQPYHKRDEVSHKRSPHIHDEGVMAIAKRATQEYKSLDSEDRVMRDSWSSGNHHTYQGVEMREQARQINGDVGSSSCVSNAKNHYVDVKAIGSGWQLNGNISIDGLMRVTSQPICSVGNG